MTLPDRDHQAPSKIHTEPVKQEHVSHWDRDYLSTEELEARYNTPGQAPTQADAEPPADDHDQRDAGA
ncbi:hypothetical protein Pla123a_20500 [Posidoniimonas polymericola]|uniref:Uncharacterized protein n=1 Tax=Posidoniimonas polymericola TaxID=2528002 RepID=A0A5C5YR94_9BACT|nr:hypothetical protein [Posidoniimonas polymericola]TWT77389.1 hypothetical protein Pla123a_20500 [Posidoniimonas polymericola]